MLTTTFSPGIRLEKLNSNSGHSVGIPIVTLISAGKVRTMRIFQWMKRAIQFVFDPDMYYLAWLALKNQLKSQQPSKPAAKQNEKKRAKAFNSH